MLTTTTPPPSENLLNFCQTTRRHISEVAYIYVGTLNNSYTKQYEFLSALALVVTRNIKRKKYT